MPNEIKTKAHVVKSDPYEIIIEVEHSLTASYSRSVRASATRAWKKAMKNQRDAGISAPYTRNWSIRGKYGMRTEPDGTVYSILTYSPRYKGDKA